MFYKKKDGQAVEVSDGNLTYFLCWLKLGNKSVDLLVAVSKGQTHTAQLSSMVSKSRNNCRKKHRCSHERLGLGTKNKTFLHQRNGKYWSRCLSIQWWASYREMSFWWKDFKQTAAALCPFSLQSQKCCSSCWCCRLLISNDEDQKEEILSR